MKYLAIIKYTNGNLAPVIFDSLEEMNGYINNTYIPNIEDVILKIAFSTEKRNNYVDVLSQ